MNEHAVPPVGDEIIISLIKLLAILKLKGSWCDFSNVFFWSAFFVITSYSIHYTKLYEMPPWRRRMSVWNTSRSASLIWAQQALHIPDMILERYFIFRKLSNLIGPIWKQENPVFTNRIYWQDSTPQYWPPAIGRFSRITSYNVCYTKLLRFTDVFLL